jgi:hypothetical protein
MSIARPLYSQHKSLLPEPMGGTREINQEAMQEVIDFITSRSN